MLKTTMDEFNGLDKPKLKNDLTNAIRIPSKYLKTADGLTYFRINRFLLNTDHLYIQGDDAKYKGLIADVTLVSDSEVMNHILDIDHLFRWIDFSNFSRIITEDEFNQHLLEICETFFNPSEGIDLAETLSRLK